MDEDSTAARAVSISVTALAALLAFASVGNCATAIPPPPQVGVPVPSATPAPSANSSKTSVSRSESISIQGGVETRVTKEKYSDGTESVSTKIGPRRPPIEPAKLGPPPKVDLVSMRERPALQSKFTQATAAEVIKIYNELNSQNSPGYAEGLIAVELFAYCAAADNQHGECWYQIAASYAELARQQGCHDSFVLAICGAFHLLIGDLYKGSEARERLDEVLAFQSSPYPPVVKLETLPSAMKYLSLLERGNADPGVKPDDDQPSITDMLDAGVNQLEALARQGAAPGQLRYGARAILTFVPVSGSRRERYETLVADALARAKAPERVAAILRAEYLIDKAYAARGLGISNSMFKGDAREMERCFKEAKELLVACGKQYPDEVRVPALMLKVGEGQDMSKAEMEEWFQKAQAIDPNFSTPYCSKMWFLQPSRYGSRQEMLDFGVECLHTERWDAGIPLMLISGVKILATDVPDIYQNQTVCDLVDNTYVEFLRRYPASLSIRTQYLEFALMVGDWRTAKDQLAILGDYWDITEIDPIKYAEIRSTLEKH